jgi:hypothetical protein
LTLEYEQKITKFFSIEAGVGFQFPYYVKELMEIWVSDEYLPYNVKSGFSWRVNPRFFFNRKGPEGFNTGPMYRERYYFSGGGNKTVFRDITWNYGYHFMPWKKITLDCYYGVGVRLKQLPQSSNYFASTVFGRINVVMPIGIKIGYILY